MMQASLFTIWQESELIKTRSSKALILILFIMTSCASVPENDQSEVWIDVRSPQEYQLSHITGHPNIPHTVITENIDELVPAKDTPVYLYCRSGNRAGKAKMALEAIGYTNVFNAGGIEEVRADLTVQD